MRKNLQLAFLGPQGSGKGTQATLLEHSHGFAVLGMGAMLRQAAQAETDLGRQIKELTTSGKLVPTALTIDILVNHLSQLAPEQGFILDGFPRSLDQAEQLEVMKPLDSIVVFEISDQEAVRRIVTRINCPHGHVFNTITHKPKVTGVCDYDGEALTRREDDHEEAVRQRLAIYHSETERVLEFYEKLGKVIRINGEQEIPKIHHHLEVVLKSL